MRNLQSKYTDKRRRCHSVHTQQRTHGLHVPRRRARRTSNPPRAAAGCCRADQLLPSILHTGDQNRCSRTAGSSDCCTVLCVQHNSSKVCDQQLNQTTHKNVSERHPHHSAHSVRQVCLTIPVHTARFSALPQPEVSVTLPCVHTAAPRARPLVRLCSTLRIKLCQRCHDH